MRPWPVLVLAALACGEKERPVWTGPGFTTDPQPPPPMTGAIVTTNNGSDTISVVDVAADQLMANIPVGFIPVALEGPHHIAADPAGKFVYVNLSEAVVGSGT